jgi:hypothetical protein
MSQPKLFLFLDDTEERHKHFYKLCSHHDVVTFHAYNVRTALKLLHDPPFETPFDCAWLDHDLEDTGTETGFVVAEHIALHLDPRLWPKNVVIHSWNADGAIAMEAVLRNHGYLNVKRLPFSFKEYK